jgi:U3 small nucleolar RNA-associated protein 12
VLPDKTGFVTGSADGQVKFWDFALIKEESNRLTAIHTRTLKLSEEVLAVVISPNQKLMAVSLIDSTVQVFYFDSLKLSKSLYGHKLPVLCMDISSDSTLIVTGSADKNIKIWGLDFGDCHRSIFAHNDSIMSIKFVWGTHYVFSCSKDKTIKYWDMDKYENISTFTGHISEVWSIAVGKFGNFFVSGSHDRSIRTWRRTDEQLFLEEEREKEIDQQADESLAQDLNDPQGDNAEASSVALANTESLKAGERIMKALDLFQEEKEKLAQSLKYGEDPESVTPHILLSASGCPDPESYVLQAFEKIRSSDLEAALLVIPFSYVPNILYLTNHWASKNWNASVTCRVLFFLLKVHHNQIVASRSLRPVLADLQKSVRKSVEMQRDLVGKNVAALRYLKREKEFSSSSSF